MTAKPASAAAFTSGSAPASAMCTINCTAAHPPSMAQRSSSIVSRLEP